jgi:uncharacterized protein (DUF2267 family)
MDYEEFISIVKQWADLRDEEAERAIRVVLLTLAERISTGEARDLVSQLPAELGPWLLTEHGGQRFDVDEFLRRVAEHEETDIATAERHVRAVLAALSGALDSDEFADLEAQLPKDYFYLLPRGPDVEVWPVEELLDKVSRRAGLDRDGALRATEAVLAAIAERPHQPAAGPPARRAEARQDGEPRDRPAHAARRVPRPRCGAGGIEPRAGPRPCQRRLPHLARGARQRGVLRRHRPVPARVRRALDAPGRWRPR